MELAGRMKRGRPQNRFMDEFGVTEEDGRDRWDGDRWSAMPIPKRTCWKKTNVSNRNIPFSIDCLPSPPRLPVYISLASATQIMYKDEEEQNRKLLVLLKQIHLNNSESTFNEKRRKKWDWKKNNALFLFSCNGKKNLSASQRDWFPCSQGGQLSYQRCCDVILIMTASVPPCWDDVFGCCLRYLKLLKQQSELTDKQTSQRADKVGKPIPSLLTFKLQFG